MFLGWELLKDPAGRDHFLSFLEKEYATENLLFVESVWHLKKLPASEVSKNVLLIILRLIFCFYNCPLIFFIKYFRLQSSVV